MENALGKTTWLLPDMFWPTVTHGDSYVSHEAVCVLNVGNADAKVTLTLFYEDREPVEGFCVVCPAMRTTHIRMDMLKDAKGEPVPRGVGYAARVTSDVPVVVQYTRVDTTQPELALMTAMAYPLS